MSSSQPRPASTAFLDALSATTERKLAAFTPIPSAVALYTREFAAVAGGPAGDAAVRDGALGLALTALDHLVDPDLRQAVHDDFAAQGGPLEVEGYFG